MPSSSSGAGEVLTGVPLYVLMSLRAGPRHGYSLMQDIERFAGVRLGPGTLYKSLSRLEVLGLITALEPEDRRLPYALTGEGADALNASLRFLGDLVTEGDRRVKAASKGRAAHAY